MSSVLDDGRDYFSIVTCELGYGRDIQIETYKYLYIIKLNSYLIYMHNKSVNLLLQKKSYYFYYVFGLVGDSGWIVKWCSNY